MQEYILKNFKDFNPIHTFECGQCFRWNLEVDGSYTGVFERNILNVKKQKDDIIFLGICDGDIKEICNKYFDLNKNYDVIKKELSRVDIYLAKSIEYGNGIRILNQNLWETIISFIISANNNIPRIKGIIEKLAKNFGDKIKFNEKEYYTFPTISQLSKASIEELRKIGLGFRDKRVYETTRIFLEDNEKLERLKQEKNIDILREELLELPGVGPKVADCIMLFSLKKMEVFPIDVWVRRIINMLYIKNVDEKQVSKNEILKLANKKYGNLAGIAQQYLFYWSREQLEDIKTMAKEA